MKSKWKLFSEQLPTEKKFKTVHILITNPRWFWRTIFKAEYCRSISDDLQYCISLPHIHNYDFGDMQPTHWMEIEPPPFKMPTRNKKKSKKYQSVRYKVVFSNGMKKITHFYYSIENDKHNVIEQFYANNAGKGYNIEYIYI